MSIPWTPLLALGGTLLPLLWVKRWITQRLQELSLRWVGDPDVALVLYFVLVLPGVVIHELSHWLMAVVLRVRVRRFSIGPRRKGRSRQVSLGSIQVANVDRVRGSFIGLAPLLGGSAVILLIGNQVLGVDDLVEMVAGQGVTGILASLEQLIHVADFWLWLYLIFAVSNAMLPSESDMASLSPVLIFLGIAAAVIVVVGGVPVIPEVAVEGVSALASYLASAFALTLAVDLVFMIVIGLLLWLTATIQEKSR